MAASVESQYTQSISWRSEVMTKVPASRSFDGSTIEELGTRFSRHNLKELIGLVARLLGAAAEPNIELGALRERERE